MTDFHSKQLIIGNASYNIQSQIMTVHAESHMFNTCSCCIRYFSLVQLVSFDHTCSFWNLLSIWSMLVQETLPLGCLLGWQWIVVLQAAVQRYIAACLQHLLSWSWNYANWSSSGCNSWLDWADWAGDVPTTGNFFFLYNKSLFTCCRLFRQCFLQTNYDLCIMHF